MEYAWDSRRPGTILRWALCLYRVYNRPIYPITHIHSTLRIMVRGGRDQRRRTGFMITSYTNIWWVPMENALVYTCAMRVHWTHAFIRILATSCYNAHTRNTTHTHRNPHMSFRRSHSAPTHLVMGHHITRSGYAAWMCGRQHMYGFAMPYETHKCRPCSAARTI